MLLDTSSAFWTVLLLDDSASRACHVSEKYTIPLDGAFGCPHVHPLCTKRYVSTRDHKTFFPYFSGRANSISQQSTAVTVKSAENLDISPSQQKIPKCVFKKMLVLIAIWRFLMENVQVKVYSSAIKIIWD